MPELDWALVTKAPHVLGLAGWSGSGKTTLAVQLIEGLSARGLRIASLKHAHHKFDVDTPGKDSYRHRAAGAAQVLVSSANRWALMSEVRGGKELGLGEALAKFDKVDLILVEGFKTQAFPKLEIHRPSLGHTLLAAEVPGVIAVASDAPATTTLPVLNLNDVPQILDFIQRFIDTTEPWPN